MMRISGGKTCLAIVALSLGVASAQTLRFIGFGSTIVNGTTTAIHQVDEQNIAPQPLRFKWQVLGAPVEINMVHLYSWNPLTDAVDKLGSNRDTSIPQPILPPEDGTPTDEHNPQIDNPDRTASTSSATATSTSRSEQPGTVIPILQNRDQLPSILTEAPAISAEGNNNLPDVPFSVRSTPEGGDLEINDAVILLALTGQALFFEFISETTGSPLTNSRLFAVVRKGDEEAIQELYNNAPGLGDDKPFNASEVSPPGGGSFQPSASITPTPTGFGRGREPSSQGSASGSGLSNGAVIGIGVACAIVGIAMIGALIWLFLRRRKKARKLPAELDGTFNKGRTPTNELIAQKESNDGMDHSPHSPYSDDGDAGAGASYRNNDGSSLHFTPSNTAAAVPSGQKHYQSPPQPISQHPLPQHSQQHTRDVPRSYSPYSDRVASAVGSPSTRAASLVHADNSSRAGMESPAPGRGTPHGLPAQYAHLVEEGMTEDEIRRLEEEERQLDAAIEQAGRRGA